MGDERAPVLALTKTTSDGRTATVHIEWHGYYGSNRGVVVSVSRLDGQEIGNHCGSHHLRPNMPPGHVAAVGRLVLTQAEADQVQAAYDAFVAALPRDLHAERRALVGQILEAEDRWADNRAQQWERFDQGHEPTGLHDPAGEQRIRQAREALAAFDAEHAGIAAQAAEEQRQDALRAFND